MTQVRWGDSAVSQGSKVELPSSQMWAPYPTNYLRFGEAQKGENVRVEAARQVTLLT